MKNRYFKGFSHFFGRAIKSAAQTLKEPLNEVRGRALGQLHSLFVGVVECEKIAGANSLRDAVSEIRASVCAADAERDISKSTGSYNAARKRLPQSSVDAVHLRVCEKMMPSGGILDGRRVMVVDATSGQLEDTARNQQ